MCFVVLPGGLIPPLPSFFFQIFIVESSAIIHGVDILYRNKELLVQVGRGVVNGFPIFMTSDITRRGLLHPPRSHDDDKTLLFPHHSPKITASLRQRTLRAYECIFLFISIDKICVYVVRWRVVINLWQTHSAVVVAKHVCVSVLGLITSESGRERKRKKKQE